MIWGISRGVEKDRHQQKDGKFGLRSPKVKTHGQNRLWSKGSVVVELPSLGIFKT